MRKGRAVLYYIQYKLLDCIEGSVYNPRGILTRNERERMLTAYHPTMKTSISRPVTQKAKFRWLCAALCCAAMIMPMGGAAMDVSLPQPRKAGGMSLEEALRMRRSVRDYADRAITLTELAQICWAGQGAVRRGNRTAPSAGALYPIEVLVAAGRVDGLAPGVYRYISANHSLRLVRQGDIRQQLASAALGQECVRDAPIVIVIAAVYERLAGKYGGRSERYAVLEAGHVSQNIYLQATSLGLGTVAVGAFNDTAVARAAGLGGDERPLYLMPVGRPMK